MALIQSLGRVALGFAVAGSLALILGILMGISAAVERNLDPLVESFRPIAAIALLPLAILWFGTGTPAAVFIVALRGLLPDHHQHDRRREARRPDAICRRRDAWACRA